MMMTKWIYWFFSFMFICIVFFNCRGQVKKDNKKVENTSKTNTNSQKRKTIPRIDYTSIPSTVIHLEEKKNFDCLYPQLELKSLYHDVAINEIFDDVRIFANSKPKEDISLILINYNHEKEKEDFDLKLFVEDNFIVPVERKYVFNKDISINEHIDDLWKHNYFKGDSSALAQKKQGMVLDENSTSIQVLYPYIATNRLYNTLSYWDSYFLLLGLLNADDSQAVLEMMKNFRNIIDTFGYVPPSNKCYNLGYAGPPVLQLMLLAFYGQDYSRMKTFIKTMEEENKYWMKSTLPRVSQNFESDNRVMLFRTTQMNRYYVNSQLPTTDNYLDDLSVFFKKYKPATLYTDLELNIFIQLNTLKESNWGMSSRWLEDPKDDATIKITDLTPVDLNTLLYMQEDLIYQYYRSVNNQEKMTYYFNHSESRRKIILQYNWNKKEQFFTDYDFAKSQPMSQLTLAGVMPLYAKIANKHQAKAVAQVIKNKFLKPYGVITSEDDHYNNLASHSWSPMIYFTIIGLNNYGFTKLAEKIKNKWINNVEQTYKSTGKLYPKYNAIFQGNINEESKKTHSNIATSGIYRYFTK